MKEYMITKERLSQCFDEILLAIDKGVQVTLKATAELDEETCCQLAALGQLIFMDCWFWYRGVEETLDNLLLHSPERIILNVNVTKNNIEDVHKTLSEIEARPKYMSIKVRLMEPDLKDPTGYLCDQKWNELIVSCYDHNINLCWGGDAASYRYVEYIKETTDV